MMRSERMSKFNITLPQSVLENVVRELHRLNLVHIVEHSKGEIDIGSPMDKSEKFSELIVIVRALKAQLGLEGKKELSNGFRAVGVKNFDELSTKIQKIRQEASQILDNIKESDDKIRALRVKEKELEILSALPLPLDVYTQSSIVTWFVGKIANHEAVNKEIENVTKNFEFISSKTNPELAAIFVQAEKAREVRDILSAHKFHEITLDVQDPQGEPESMLAKVKHEINAELKNSKKAHKELDAIAKKYYDFLLLSETFIDIEVEQANAPLTFASTGSAYLIRGWAPTADMPKITKKLEESADEKIYIQEEKIDLHHDDVPVKLSNPGPAKPFEFFMRLYTLPKYSEIDPTFITFITFPLFFGIILGDVGYGLVIFLLTFALSKQLKALGDMVPIIRLAGLFSILFGFVFGEFFGEEYWMGSMIPHALGRLAQINELMIAAVSVGFLHINLGLMVGFVNELSHGFKAALLEKASWFVLQAGVIMLALNMFGVVAIPSYISWTVFSIAVIMIYLGEGFKGIIELPAIFSNMLSYARLMAVGVASAGLAVVVNDFTKQFFIAGGPMIIAGVLIFMVGHTINIGLGLLGGFLHPIRLHYVEFFSKFLKGGAIGYKPFGHKNE